MNSDIQQYQRAHRLEIARKIDESIKQPHSTFIFGSTSRDTLRKDSDLDLMIILPSLNLLEIITSPYIPEISWNDLYLLPETTTNVCFESFSKDVPVHLEVYSAQWIRGLLESETMPPHQTAIYDPEEKIVKKSFGRSSSLTGETITFPRNIFRTGPFVLFDDYEPSLDSRIDVLRIEQRKLAFCEEIKDTLNLEPSLKLNRSRIINAMEQIVDRQVSFDDLSFVFSRAEVDGAHRLKFSSSKLDEAVSLFNLPAEELSKVALTRQIPRSLRVSITDLCNLRCEYCQGDGTEPKGPQNCTHMPVSYFEKLLLIWRSLGGTKVKLTGGEPLLHPELSSFLACAHKLGIKSSITTNAHALDYEVIEVCQAYGVNLVISLDRITPGMVSKLSPVGLDGSEIAKRVLLARDAGLNVAVNAVLDVQNQNSLVNELIPWALHNGIFVRILEEGFPLDGDSGKERVGLPSFIRTITDQFDLSLHELANNGDSFFSNNGKVVLQIMVSYCAQKNSDACEDILRINPSGEAIVCMHGGQHIPVNTAEDLLCACDLLGVCFPSVP